jgi:hypothetical protein
VCPHCVWPKGMDLVEVEMHTDLHENTSVVAAHCVTQESMHSVGEKSPHHVEQPS